ncbi:hypothetical protein KIW84_074165 [Lathyrus oleraceus]|uniref:Uncharacterized protein n=1 Tax=Pisum sativum TaxID=3888 RepID=A0A9D4VTB7_PEA|nr:hypothetical protein KIW84_074165 [Pisum sativum]
MSSQHQQQKHHLPQPRFSRNPDSSAQQQAKLLKGKGRGNMLIHQNNSVDPSHINGLSVASGSQPVEKGDQNTQMMQGQTLYPGSGLDPSQPPKPPVSLVISGHIATNTACCCCSQPSPTAGAISDTV